MPSEINQQMVALQDLLVTRATGGVPDDADYLRLRQVALADLNTSSLIPEFVQRYRDLFQFWEFIKHEYSTYADRRRFLWDSFRPLLDHLDSLGERPADSSVQTALGELSSEYVHSMWSRALDRRTADPEGAITLARTILETVCKHILDALAISYDDGNDLPKLYRSTAESLGIAPSQHTEEVFKRILGGCTSVVEGLGALRNRLSDSHGSGPGGVRPAPRHAELAVNLAGSMAAYLVATWQYRQEPQA